MEEVSIINDTQVRVFIYDLAKGLAKLFSQPPLGERRINGLWHTSVVVYGHEYFYGKNGICAVKPCGTLLGNPLEILKLGTTQFEYSAFQEFISGLEETKFKSQAYELFGNNCNKFTQEVVAYLTGKKIPEYLSIIPKEVINTQLGDSLKTLLEPVNLSVENRFVKTGKTKTKETKNVKETATLNVIGESQSPTDTTEVVVEVEKTVPLDLVVDEPLKEGAPVESKVFEPVSDAETVSNIEILKETSGNEDIAEEKIELWELNESFAAFKKREISPLVINNIDDSKYPQLLCYFKRTTVKEE